MTCTLSVHQLFWQPVLYSGSTQTLNLSAARALAFAASSSRFFGAAFVSRERRRRVDAVAISSMAAANDASLAFDGLLKPVIFLTYCSDAARTSPSLTGGSKLKRVLMFLHIERDLRQITPGSPILSCRINGCGKSPT